MEEKRRKGQRAQKAKEGERAEPEKKLLEVKTLVDLVLDEAASDKTAEQWESAFGKSVICEIKKLGGLKEEFADTDEERL